MNVGDDYVPTTAHEASELSNREPELGAVGEGECADREVDRLWRQGNRCQVGEFEASRRNPLPRLLNHLGRRIDPYNGVTK